MKPVFSEGRLTVELHKPEIGVLQRAIVIAESLVALHQEKGAPLVAAIVAILEGDSE